MTVLAVLELKLKPDTLDEARTVVHRVLEETRAFEGCAGVEVMIDGQDPTRFVAVERWESSAADEAYREFRAGPGAISDLGPLLAGPPSLIRGAIDAGL